MCQRVIYNSIHRDVLNASKEKGVVINMTGSNEIVATAIQALTLIITIVSFIVYITIKVSKIEVKVDTLWEFIMRRTKAEATVEGFGVFHSPFRAIPEFENWFSDDFKQQLRVYYNNYCKKMSDMDLFIEIEKVFGEKISNEICLPHGLTTGSLVWVAMSIMKEENK